MLKMNIKIMIEKINTMTNDIKYVVEIEKHNGIYLKFVYNSLEELNNIWSITDEYNQYDEYDMCINTSATEMMRLKIKEEKLERVVKLFNNPVIHLINNGEKVYYKSQSIEYEKTFDMYDDSNLYNISEYVPNEIFIDSNKILNCEKFNIMIYDYNEKLIELFSFERHIPKKKIILTIGHNFKEMKPIEYLSDKKLDFIDNGIYKISINDIDFYEGDSIKYKDDKIFKIEDKDFLEIFEKHQINLETVQFINIYYNDRVYRWIKYYKPTYKLSDSICEKYLENISINRHFTDFITKYKPYYKKYSQRSFLVIPNNDNKDIERNDRVFNSFDLIRPIYWNERLGGWISSMKNEDIFKKHKMYRKYTNRYY